VGEPGDAPQRIGCRLDDVVGVRALYGEHVLGEVDGLVDGISASVAVCAGFGSWATASRAVLVQVSNVLSSASCACLAYSVYCSYGLSAVVAVMSASFPRLVLSRA
jgi:hypothetical protein